MTAAALFTWISLGAFISAGVLLAAASVRREREVGDSGAVRRGPTAHRLLLAVSLIVLVSIATTIFRVALMAF